MVRKRSDDCTCGIIPSPLPFECTFAWPDLRNSASFALSIQPPRSCQHDGVDWRWRDQRSRSADSLSRGDARLVRAPPSWFPLARDPRPVSGATGGGDAPANAWRACDARAQRAIRRWPTPARLARARISTIAAVIRPLGLTKRARILSSLGRSILASGDVPLDPEALQQLPGVGPYAAHAVPVFATGQNLAVVDWVIARVLRRYFGLAGDRRPNQDRELWALAHGLAARGDARRLWLGVLDFAAGTCRPHPLCPPRMSSRAIVSVCCEPRPARVGQTHTELTGSSLGIQRRPAGCSLGTIRPPARRGPSTAPTSSVALLQSPIRVHPTSAWPRGAGQRQARPSQPAVKLGRATRCTS